MEIEEAFYLRLANWRRVYGDKSARWVSPTDTFCRYAKIYFERAKETEEEKFWREVSELRYREPKVPAPDYEDAERLQNAWKALPDTIDGVPVKRCVKVFVFGSRREFERLKRYAKVTAQTEDEWRTKFLKAFKDRVEAGGWASKSKNFDVQ